MSKPMAAAGLLAVLTGAWYWALVPAVPPMPPGGGRANVRVDAAPPVVPTVRLDALARGGAPLPPPDETRDPFREAASRSTSAQGTSQTATSAAPAVLTPPAPPAPVWPRVELIGVAEAREGGRVVRTAILSGRRGVQHAAAGDLIEEVYRVERIGADGVDLRLVPESRTVRLALRP